MATTVSAHFIIGLEDLTLDSVGGNFSAGTDLSDVFEDGVDVEFEVNNQEIADARDIGLTDILQIAHKCIIRGQWLKYSKEKQALALGHAISDVIDNTGATPPNLELKGGTFQEHTKYALRLRQLQSDSSTLFDIWELFNGIFVNAYASNYSYRGGPAFLPFEYHTLQGSSGPQWSFKAEGV